MRSLTIVSLAQYLIAQSHSKSAVSRYECMKSYLLVISIFQLGNFLNILFPNMESIINKKLRHFTNFIYFSALAAFYARDFAEKVPDVKPPSLQVIFCIKFSNIPYIVYKIIFSKVEEQG